jgi:hypothetical protein
MFNTAGESDVKMVFKAFHQPPHHYLYFGSLEAMVYCTCFRFWLNKGCICGAIMIYTLDYLTIPFWLYLNAIRGQAS